MRVSHVLVSLVVLLPFSIAARQGWYVDFATGMNSEVQLNNIRNNFPNGIMANSETGPLQILDLGYSFKGGLSLGTGFEFANFVDIGYKLLVKWSFAEDRDFQPYIFSCIHGGISDIVLTSLHVGLGFDYFFTKKAYMSLDGRIGPCLVSGDPYKDPVTGKANYDYQIEGTLALGVGVLFGHYATKN